jgi:hypothetical protein
MTLTYSIPLQTITFEWSVAEQEELTQDALDKIKTQFQDLITWVKQQNGKT